LQEKKKSKVIVNSEDYFKNFSIKKEYVCHAPKVFTTLKADGSIYSCKGKYWGNVKENSFKKVLQSDEYKEFCIENESCNNCTVSCVLETSEAYTLKPKFYFDKLVNFF